MDRVYDMEMQSLAHVNFLPVTIKQEVKGLMSKLVDNHVWHEINKNIQGSLESSKENCEFLFDEIDRVLNPFLIEEI